jgi:hypothetical protein
MRSDERFREVFTALKAILKKHEKKLVVVTDDDDHYYLDSPIRRKDGKSICFGAARIGKNYVSFHLMPVYGCPELIKSMSPELKKHMQGKSCFNFKVSEPKLFKELAALTKAGLAGFKELKLA